MIVLLIGPKVRACTLNLIEFWFRPEKRLRLRASEDEYVIVFCLFIFLASAPTVTSEPKTFCLLDHFDVNFVGVGAAFNLNWHERSLSCFLFSLRLVTWRYGLAD